jgi:hypothetical protein
MKWRLHDPRHWPATVSIGQGHDVRTVAGRLGRSNPAMTLRVYAHAFAAADQALAAGLGDLLRGDDDWMQGPVDQSPDESRFRSMSKPAARISIPTFVCQPPLSSM